MISVNAIGKKYRETQVLSRVSLDLHRNEFVAVIGPSGSGKTTLLRCINHLEMIDEGEINFGRTNIRAGRRLSSAEAADLRGRIAMVFQSLNLWPFRTVMENIVEGAIYCRKLPKGIAHEAGRRWAGRLGIENQLSKYPHQLSGGQRQRVAICRAIVTEPEFLLLDEITAALDPVMAGQVSDILLELKDEGLGIIAVTHQIDFARRNADRVVFMQEGTIVELGSREILSTPKSAELRAFVELVRRGW